MYFIFLRSLYGSEYFSVYCWNVQEISSHAGKASLRWCTGSALGYLWT